MSVALELRLKLLIVIQKQCCCVWAQHYGQLVVCRPLRGPEDAREGRMPVLRLRAWRRYGVSCIAGMSTFSSQPRPGRL